MQVQPRIYCAIFIITNESRDQIYEFCGSYIEAVEKYDKYHYFYEDRCIAKVHVTEDPVFGSCVTAKKGQKPDPELDDYIPF